MTEKNDWRLTGHEDYLCDLTLYLRKYKAPKPEWDHDHCDLCWAELSERPDTLNEGYAFRDNSRWICPKCFADFRETFRWKVVDERDK